MIAGFLNHQQYLMYLPDLDPCQKSNFEPFHSRTCVKLTSKTGHVKMDGWKMKSHFGAFRPIFRNKLLLALKDFIWLTPAGCQLARRHLRRQVSYPSSRTLGPYMGTRYLSTVVTLHKSPNLERRLLIDGSKKNIKKHNYIGPGVVFLSAGNLSEMNKYVIQYIICYIIMHFYM